MIKPKPTVKIAITWHDRTKTWILEWWLSSGTDTRRGHRIVENTCELDEPAVRQLVRVMVDDLEARLPW